MSNGGSFAEGAIFFAVLGRIRTILSKKYWNKNVGKGHRAEGAKLFLPKNSSILASWGGGNM